MSAVHGMLLVVSYLLLCLNLSLAFPMWYGHPMVMGTYQRDGDWWGGRGLFSGWGQQPLQQNGDMDEDSRNLSFW